MTLLPLVKINSREKTNMCEEYFIARRIVLQAIATQDSFTYNGLLSEIEKSQGLPQISPSRTLKEYLDSFELKGAIIYNPETRGYEVPTNMISQ